MCFSASASFTASGGLTAFGIASFSIAKGKNKILAAIPLLFAVQQGLEGMQWIALGHGSPFLFAGYGFLFFSFILWPIYVPLFVYVLDKPKQKFLRWFIWLGSAIAAYFLALLLTEPILIIEENRCINYHFVLFPFQDFIVFAYIIVILAPLLFSDIKAFKWFGGIIAITALIAWLFFTLAFTSVWCFFAAIISSLFFFYIWKIEHPRGKLSSL